MLPKRGFTLIEMVIVLGVIGVISATLIVAINPAEAQKKSRDMARLKDSQDIVSILEQFTLDKRTATGCLNSESGCQSCPIDGTVYPNTCEADKNWLQEDLCQYTQKVPVDPKNCRTIKFIGGTEDNPGYVQTQATYIAKVSGRSYKVETMMEAQANASIVNDDRGRNLYIAETGNNINLVTTLDTTLTGNSESPTPTNTVTPIPYTPDYPACYNADPLSDPANNNDCYFNVPGNLLNLLDPFYTSKLNSAQINFLQDTCQDLQLCIADLNGDRAINGQDNSYIQPVWCYNNPPTNDPNYTRFLNSDINQDGWINCLEKACIKMSIPQTCQQSP